MESQHRQRRLSGRRRKSSIERCPVLIADIEIGRAAIFFDPFRLGAFGDGKHAVTFQKEGERHLSRRRLIGLGDADQFMIVENAPCSMGE